MAKISPEVALKIYEIMLKTRRLAEALRKIYYEGKTLRFKLGAVLIWWHYTYPSSGTDSCGSNNSLT